MVFVLSLAALQANAQSTDARLPDWVAAWVRACQAVPGCTVVWKTGVPHTDAAGTPLGVMTFRHSLLYRWPDCLRRDEEYLGGGPESPGAQRQGMAMLYERSVVITPDAHRWTLSASRPSAPELGVPLDSHYVLPREIPSTPWLLGRWLADHPDDFTFESMPDQAVRVVVPALRLRAALSRIGELAIVRSLDEFQHGNIVLRYEFDDVRTSPGWSIPLAHARTLFAPGADDSLAAVHTDTLELARPEHALTDAEFSPERTRLGDRLPGLIAQARRQAPATPLEPSPAGSMLGEGDAAPTTRAFALWFWGGALASIVVVASTVWLVRRRYAPAR